MERKSSILVIGGGVAGIQASLDAANRGLRVYLVEKNPSIGGRMAQLDKTFPTMDCSICILAPKMIECFRHKNIALLTYSEVKEVSGSVGNFKVKVLKKPRFIDETKCTGCGECTQKCPVRIPNEFELGLEKRGAAYLPFLQAVPLIATIDKENCLYFQRGVCKICQRFCQADAVDFDQKPEEITLDVSAIIVATGLDLFDSSTIEEYGYKKFGNVITSLEFERLVNASGPTRGKLMRPSDKKKPRSIAFIQCVGSRSLRGGLPYCSSVCCMYATKEAILVREHEPESTVNIFHLDLRVFGKGFQEFVNRAENNWNVKYIRGLPGEITEDPKTGDLTIWHEDMAGKGVMKTVTDIVVLCPALIPNQGNKELASVLGIQLNELGFFKSKDALFTPLDTNVPGIFICGYCQGPKDIPESVSDASGTVARAMEAIMTDNSISS